MNGIDRHAPDGDEAVGVDGPVRVQCATDTVRHGLDVDWTKGAIFEFESRRAAERWVANESRSVPGTFYLADAPPDDSALSVAYYVKYTAVDG